MTASTVLARTRIRPGQCAMGQWQSFAIFVWTTRADGPCARDVVAFGDQLRVQRPHFSPIHVVESSAGLPTSEGRDTLIAPARMNQSEISCVGVLLPDAHVAAAMMRVFVGATRTLLRGQVETLVQPTVNKLVSEVLAVHQRRSGETFEPRELAAAIQAVRQLAAEHVGGVRVHP